MSKSGSGRTPTLRGATARRVSSTGRLAVRLLCLAGLVVGGRLVLEGLWIPAKAALGQMLLERAWERIDDEGEVVRPWPWADMWPVARLRLPARGLDLVVLAGASGESLAWAPGWVRSSAPPGSDGNVALAGHRDTHFRVLERLEPGELLVLETPTGERSYRVTGSRIVDRSETGVLADTDRPTLTLVTCYPFDAVVPGGPLRWVVTAIGEQKKIPGPTARSRGRSAPIRLPLVVGDTRDGSETRQRCGRGDGFSPVGFPGPRPAHRRADPPGARRAPVSSPSARCAPRPRGPRRSPLPRDLRSSDTPLHGRAGG
jgi:sortase A